MLRKLQTKTSASLLYGNLSCNGRCVAYVHHAEVIVVPDSSVLSGNPTPVVVRLPIKDEVVVKQARFIELGGTDYLVVAGQHALQIYTGDGKKCIHLQPVLSPGTAEAPRSARRPPLTLLHVYMYMSLPCGAPYLATPPYLAHPLTLLHPLASFFRGLAGVTAGGGDFLCAGTSSGEIALLACNAGSFGHPVVLKEQGTAICDLDAAPYPENPDECLMASADSSNHLLTT